MDLLDVSLACEDVNSILVEVVTVDAEKGLGNSLVQIWKLQFCRTDMLNLLDILHLVFFSRYFDAFGYLAGCAKYGRVGYP